MFASVLYTTSFLLCAQSVRASRISSNWKFTCMTALHLIPLCRRRALHYLGAQYARNWILLAVCALWLCNFLFTSEENRTSCKCISFVTSLQRADFQLHSYLIVKRASMCREMQFSNDKVCPLSALNAFYVKRMHDFNGFSKGSHLLFCDQICAIPVENTLSMIILCKFLLARNSLDK